jgi:hypothetical protein
MFGHKSIPRVSGRVAWRVASLSVKPSLIPARALVARVLIPGAFSVAAVEGIDLP